MNDETPNLEEITPEDLTRHKVMLGRLDEAQEVRQQIESLTLRVSDLMGAYRIWCEELHQRYSLSMDGSEGITAEGIVNRNQSLKGQPEE